MGCLQWFKDTNLKANHNWTSWRGRHLPVVSNGSKILIWKQITTRTSCTSPTNSCLQWFKDTNLKANHNLKLANENGTIVVSNGSKILIWKQITTGPMYWHARRSCLQWFKDTNLKANHNALLHEVGQDGVVSNGSKILIWKQITTSRRPALPAAALSPMVQRY